MTGPLQPPAEFQILEGALFPNGDSPGDDALRATIRAMAGIVQQFRQLTPYVTVGDALLRDAFRLELARITTLGLAGVDSDLSGDAVVESATALEGMRALLHAAKPAPPRGSPVAWSVLDTILAAGAAYLRAHPGFERLDRLSFIVGYANPSRCCSPTT